MIVDERTPYQRLKEAADRRMAGARGRARNHQRAMGYDRALADEIEVATISSVRLADLLALLELIEKAAVPADQMNLIEALRNSEEATIISIGGSNPDFNGQPNEAVEVSACWTDWQSKRFTGETLLEALSAADAFRQGVSVIGQPEPDDQFANTCEDRRLLKAGYKVCGSNGDREWHWQPPRGEWRDRYRTEEAAVRAALKHLLREQGT